MIDKVFKSNQNYKIFASFYTDFSWENVIKIKKDIEERLYWDHCQSGYYF